MSHDRETVIDHELADRLAAVLAELLESERQSVAGADDQKRRELRLHIARREAQMQNDAERDKLFAEHLKELPEERMPTGVVATGIEASKWLDAFESKLTGWKDELAALEDLAVDKRLIFESARNKATHLLMRAARAADLLPAAPYDRTDADGPPVVSDGRSDVSDIWHPLSELDVSTPVSGKNPPIEVRFPDGEQRNIRGGQPFYVAVVEWLVEKGHFAEGVVDRRLDRCIYPPDSRPNSKSTLLSNGMWLITDRNVDVLIKRSKLFVDVCGEDVARFKVRLK